ncbi:protein FAR-RED IMPAIRED RESPONSE 1-like isoform X2 [Tripterygium wilfordii]|uniref:protein FAR-RED IMPAIRED RESPONSE 1-like isoform X2 n=1 Tax=Tripterygium wilfordii TaxID=458696 RepID=UPI0018F83701|nr:protein FAR-RED IMPAIRED RESPONSE 1-like isoform X2 [Tripterygium wilfordii]XP_038678951.1 protein FAR-RED IMPAIRED RESPONSE 1-like isoform X2 [Tripterygium wilfordii]XP_038678952.1 protein FAR-RED IMPAIRED RESPONSE 1-like isoform X2 [Tripterygium wilfordii]
MGIDLEQLSGESHKEDSRCTVNLDAANGVDKGCGVSLTYSNVAGNNKENSGQNVIGKELDGSYEACGADGMDMDSLKNLEPHDGMEFGSKDEAFSFYKEYAKYVGFTIIIKASRRSKVSGSFIDAKFVCTRYGKKQEANSIKTPEPVSNTDGAVIIPVKRKRGRINLSWSKTDCKACMHVKRRQDGRWIVRSFIKEHNHEIFPDQAYYFRGHRNIEIGSSNADALLAIRERTKRLYVAMSRKSGGYKHKKPDPKVGVSNQLDRVQHLALEEGDAQVMLDHFIDMQDENPNFFYAIDLNQDQCLRNVFWVDAKGRLDYNNFNDIVFFDTTFVKNECKLPFAPFIGVNHHYQFLSLGCALIADETKSTYLWLMRAWLRAMGGHAPRVILTDQDNSLKEAIAEVFPDSRHCFCLWHIFSKIPEKLGYAMRQHENFMTKFNKCIFKSWTCELFEKRWLKMVDRFSLRTDTWFQSLYEDRERWVPIYMRDTFLAGMSTMQRSENTSCLFDKYLQRKTTLKEFLAQYNVFLQEKSEEEAKADFESWHKQPGLKSPSPFGKQMAALYTHSIFRKFQVEVLGVVACHPRKESEDGEKKTFRVQDFEDNQDFLVIWNEATSVMSCSCHSFEFNGFLCRHVMIVLQMSGVHSIPSQYILKRWTKDAKSRETLRDQSDVAESRVQRYNDLCRRAFKLGDEGSLSQESYNIAYTALEEALRECESVNNSIKSGTGENLPSSQAFRDYEEVNQGNSPSKTSKKHDVSKKKQVHPEPEVITLGLPTSWPQMEHSNLRAAALDCSYVSQEGVEGAGQLTSKGPTVDGYFGTRQLIQGMDHSNVGPPQLHGSSSKDLNSKHLSHKPP